MENHRKSHIKKKRVSGFRARSRTHHGRKILSSRRRARVKAKRG
ncbi:MAG: 50S ribosomal protein L34 [Sedimentisphaerales bacterium]|nr:50S ribosomal protein L34 [Sedimentisphaerales bacterium]NLZ06522.1 50S ribosomal protein L34 [Phycisphaerae bacterium]HNY79433.1 50S ribosomal protein L34 [Sedimentisphaerales bacterium]HOC64662.1 50S ribosomal protein L34 [Sedimentisphaerales bacterium]HOH65454.1 50S ribosomal protein L34 [Sedimentisphaerales bacterium]